MADRRYIAQEITDSGQVEQVARGAMEARGDRAVAFIATTLWSWLIAHIDDDGRVIGKPDALRSKLFARYMDLVTVAEVTEVITWMNDVDLLVWYEVQGSPGERYLYSPRFATHQTLRTDRYSPSRHPAPPGWQPEDGHPYTKNPELRKAKPQRDSRRTVRVPKRASAPVNKGEEGRSATAGKPDGNRSAPAGEPIADRSAPIGDEASPHLASPRLSSPRPSAAPRGGAAVSEGSEAASLPQDEVGPTPTIDEPLTGRWRDDRLVRVMGILLATVSKRWRRALEEIAVRVNTPANFETWFAKTELEERDGFAIVRAPNAFARDWLEQHYRRLIAHVLELPASRVVIALEGQQVDLEPEPVEDAS